MKWGKTDHHQSMIRTSSKGGMVVNAINMFELNLTQSQTDEVWVCKLANRKLSPCSPALKKGASLACLSVQSLISHLCTQSGLSREDQTVSGLDSTITDLWKHIALLRAVFQGAGVLATLQESFLPLPNF